MTSNNVEQLPAELTRSGRLDATWYFGFPNKKDREEIFKIHLSKYNITLKESKLNRAIEKTNLYTGAEIEQIVKTMVRKAFINKMKNNKDKLSISTSIIDESINEVIPISKSSKEQVSNLEKWVAEGRALDASFNKSKSEELTLEDIDDEIIEI